MVNLKMRMLNDRSSIIGKANRWWSLHVKVTELENEGPAVLPEVSVPHLHLGFGYTVCLSCTPQICALDSIKVTPQLKD